jgi:hypothetical protein
VYLPRPQLLFCSKGTLGGKRPAQVCLASGGMQEVGEGETRRIAITKLMAGHDRAAIPPCVTLRGWRPVFREEIHWLEMLRAAASLSTARVPSGLGASFEEGLARGAIW